MKKSHVLIALCAFLCLSITPVFAALDYQAVPGGASSGSVDVYDPGMGAEYGYARLNYWYWQDVDSDWHYSYQIINNGDRISDSSIHFGYTYIPGLYEDTNNYDTIHSFSIDLDPDGDVLGPSDLVVGDTYARSTAAGGGGWGHSPDPGNAGVDWSVSLQCDDPLQPDPLPIAPSRWEFIDNGGTKNDYWVDIAGDNSTDDSITEYFHLASAWGPELRLATVVAGVGSEASGMVMAPGTAPIPEPATCVLLGLGSLIVAARKRGQ